jgi:hypothetical protein
MRALAPKIESSATSARSRWQVKGPSALAQSRISMFSPYAPVLQRKASCACGEGCPRCQNKLPIQTKLAVSQPGDIYEREADRVAEEVMRMPAPNLHRSCASCTAGGTTCPRCAAEENNSLQRRAENASEAGASVPENFLGDLGPGEPLDSATRVFFEPRFGRDFARVRIHTGARAEASARVMNALAYTVGQNVVFGAGEYAPGTAAGNRLMAHELAHVVQQGPSEASGRAAPVSKATGDRLQRAVRLLNCQNPSGRLRDTVGADPLSTVQAGDAQALEFLGQAINEVERTRMQIRGGATPAWPAISDRLGETLQNRLGVDPHEAELWTATGSVTSRGQPTIALLLIRLRRVQQILAGGGIRYHCLGGRCPPMSEPGEVRLGAIAFAEPEEFAIYLCEQFWKPDAPLVSRAGTLVHEAFHLYFFAPEHRGVNMWNPHCIEAFVIEAGGGNVPAADEGCCAPGAACGNGF